MKVFAASLSASFWAGGFALLAFGRTGWGLASLCVALLAALVYFGLVLAE